ncbi:hypothetical protein GGI42DRAFT_331944 [Trichoderma sp. SZMC 28013]
MRKKNLSVVSLASWFCLSPFNQPCVALLDYYCRYLHILRRRESLLVSTQVLLFSEAQINIQTSINPEVRSKNDKMEKELAECPK